MPAMLGWLSCATVRASRRKRSFHSSSLASASGRILMATCRNSFVSSARQTSPIPPEPSRPISRYVPSCMRWSGYSGIHDLMPPAPADDAVVRRDDTRELGRELFDGGGCAVELPAERIALQCRGDGI